MGVGCFLFFLCCFSQKHLRCLGSRLVLLEGGVERDRTGPGVDGMYDDGAGWV